MRSAITARAAVAAFRSSRDPICGITIAEAIPRITTTQRISISVKPLELRKRLRINASGARSVARPSPWPRHLDRRPRALLPGTAFRVIGRYHMHLKLAVLQNRDEF